MSKKKSQEERFGEFVSNIGIDAAQRQLDILKGYMSKLTRDDTAKKNISPKQRAAIAAGKTTTTTGDHLT